MTVVQLPTPSVGQPRRSRPAGDPALVDSYGRRARDLRVSLTDRCNLRCSYCMPPEGLPWLPGRELLDAAETTRLVRLAVERLGIEEVRFTGGEPLLRPELTDIVAAVAALRTPAGQPVRTALTTNGVGLADKAEALADAGLDRVSVSIDTLDPHRYRELTKRDRHAAAVEGVGAALAAGLTPVKVNSLLVRGVNEDEAPDLLAWACAIGAELRFIEHMPLDAQGAWDRTAMVTAEEILASLRQHHTLSPLPGRGSAPAERWAVTHGDTPIGTVGVIASVTRPFCGDCDRMRLTADGEVRSCLFSRRGTSLRELLRGGADDAELAELWRAEAWAKRAGHGIDDPSFLRPDRSMSAIGG